MTVNFFSLLLQQSDINLGRWDTILIRVNVHLGWRLNSPQGADRAF